MQVFFCIFVEKKKPPKTSVNGGRIFSNPDYYVVIHKAKRSLDGCKDNN